MLKLLKNGMEYSAKDYANAFSRDTDARCVFISRDEERLEKQREKFVEAIQRKTGAHLLTIDMAQMAAEGKTPLIAVYEALCALADKVGVSIPAECSKTRAVEKLSERLCVQRVDDTIPTPILYLKHFQCCKLTVSSTNLSDYLFLRTIPCRLIISSNMEISDIEQFFISIGGVSVLASVTDPITIENDVPYRGREISKACAAVMK